MIRHTVVFTLKHAAGSAEEAEFLATARALADIPGVERFEQLRQVSPKSEFAFSFSMEFADEQAYQGYNEHPVHVAFVRDRWQSEVVDFQELDFVPLG
ncbi:Dabb family protein [Motilibacter deserti]|uniref:Dabb family protein n=1 Tax=Motilibacter deserti TaxID=2714956 RepID=A0ABX0GVN2_9ACTN|nr:Dabb family protein [Motilibacter deserti]